MGLLNAISRGEVLLNVLVTGGAGFIGRALVPRIAERAAVIVVDCLDPQVHAEPMFPAPVAQAAQCIRADVRDTTRYAQHLRSVDIVVHLAAQTGTAQSMYQLQRYTSNNLTGTAALLEAITETSKHASRIVLASSRAVYGDGVARTPDGYRPATRKLEDLKRRQWEPLDEDGRPVCPLPMQFGQPTIPTSVYGLTKLWQEQLLGTVCESRDIDYAVLRFQNVFGPGQAIHNPYTGILGYFSGRISRGEEVEVFEDGLMTRDFVFVDDAVEALRAAILHPRPVRSTLDVGSGIGTPLIEVASAIAGTWDKPLHANISGRFRAGDVRHAKADLSHINALFGYMPQTTLSTGLAQYRDWFRKEAIGSQTRHNEALRELEQRGLLGSAIAPA